MQSPAVSRLPLAPKFGCKRQLPPWGWCWAEGQNSAAKIEGGGLPPPRALSLLRAPWDVAGLWLVDPLQRATPECPGEVPTSAAGSCTSWGGGFRRVFSMGGWLSTLGREPPPLQHPVPAASLCPRRCQVCARSFALLPTAPRWGLAGGWGSAGVCPCTHIPGSNQRSRQGFFPPPSKDSNPAKLGLVSSGSAKAISLPGPTPGEDSVGQDRGLGCFPRAQQRREEQCPLPSPLPGTSQAKPLGGHKKPPPCPPSLGPSLKLLEGLSRDPAQLSTLSQGSPGWIPNPEQPGPCGELAQRRSEEAQLGGSRLPLEILPASISSVGSCDLSHPVSTCWET